MELIISRTGEVRCVYAETLDLTCLGTLSIRRASHVEPDETGRWRVDLRPVSGPEQGPFPLRSQALAAEHAWLSQNWLTTSRNS